MISILTQVASFASTWFEGQQKKTEAKALAEAAMENAKAEVFKRKSLSDQDWDFTALNQAETSWKDEYLLILYSIPFVMAFIPPLQPYVQQGFVILETTPDWYKAGMALILAASFGMRSYVKFWRK